LALLLCCNAALAQDSCFLRIENDGTDKDIFGKHMKQNAGFLSCTDKDKYVQNILLNLYEAGYLSAYYTNKEVADTSFVYIYKGNKIYWAKLRADGDAELFLAGTKYRSSHFENTVFRFSEVVALMKNMLVFAENNGYPFATVKLDSVQLSDTSVAAKLLMNRGQKVLFDTIEVKGNLQVSKFYLQQYTGITPGELYNESLVKKVDERLDELPFASVKNPAQVFFSGNKAKLVVYLDKKNASKFDFLIGVLPNNEIAGRLVITGEGALRLHNVFNAGEIFDVHFSKLELSTKELQSRCTYPYLPFVALGLDGTFNLFLKDSTFLERTASLGIVYQFIGNNSVKAFTSFYHSDVLSVDTASVILTKTLPDNLDMRSVNYGLALTIENLDYIYNPRRGFNIVMSSSAGTKKILQNNAVVSLIDPLDPGFDFATLYDSIDERSLNINYQYDLSYYQPVLRNTTLVFKLNGASIINKNIFANELFRIGGINLLRGFDEKSLTASQYHIITFEMRYLLSKNSYAGLFFDQGYIENRSNNSFLSDYPYGFGAGITFETKAGIFAVNYALGAQNNDAVVLRNAKIHFGYLNYF
jgi:outer membrane protein assembly factor BamA